MKLSRLVNIGAPLLVVAAVIGFLALEPIERRRLGNFCSSISPGTPAGEAFDRAKSVFGVKVRPLGKGDNFMVKSNFTYKTLCIISVKEKIVASADFSDD